MENPFTLSFGRVPKEYILRTREYNEIIDEFQKDNSLSNLYIITGLRGSGKTVLLTSLYNYFDNNDDFVAVDLNTKSNMLEDLTAALYDKAPGKYKFLKPEFNFSFQGLTISLKGSNPVTSLSLLLEKMLTSLKKHNKKLVITIDDVDKGNEMIKLIKEFQNLFRKDLPLYLIVTGLYSVVDDLEKTEGLTFLQRGQKRYLNPLNIRYIASKYMLTFNIEEKKAKELAEVTKGYAFAYQVLGYLLFEKGNVELDENLFRDFDYYLEEYVYNPIYIELSQKEKCILKAISLSGLHTNKELVESGCISNQEISRYKEKLGKKGICDISQRGKIEIILPRFEEFIKFHEEI